MPSVASRTLLVARGGAERLRLDDDQRDVVGDDVVQLLRDPQALVGDRALALGDDAGAAGPDVEPEAGAPPRTAARARPGRRR